MNKNEFDLFKCIVNLSQESLRKALTNTLKKKYSNVIATKEYIIAEGDIPIALVAHLDTVFTYGKRNVYYDQEQQVIWSPQGLGADDRAGVMAILKIIQDELRPTVIFTTDEELGCLGASALVAKYPTAPWPINYIIELDRQGANDCVFYQCNNPEFEDYIEKYGFINDFGSFSDISAICPKWGIAGVNLSIGYLDEHSLQETLHVRFWERTIRQVKMMLSARNIPLFQYIPLSTGNYSFGRGFYDYVTCSGCGEQFDPFLMIPVDEDKVFCPECSLTKIDWCEKCGTPYEVKDKAKHKCKEDKNDRGIEENSNAI